MPPTQHTPGRPARRSWRAVPTRSVTALTTRVMLADALLCDHSVLTAMLRPMAQVFSMSRLVLAFLALFLLSSCTPPGEHDLHVTQEYTALQSWEAFDGDHPGEHAFWEASHGGYTLLLETRVPFEQVSLLAVGDIPGVFVVEVQRATDDQWEDVPMERPWSEGRMHVMRAVLSTPGRALRVQVTNLQDVYAEVLEEARFDAGVAPLLPSPSDPPLPRAPLQPGVRPITLPLPSGTVTREEWNAHEPDQTCNPPHIPERATIHHTAGPNQDSMSAADRIRGIQTFHIEGRRWCDIGYHLLVGQDGVLYEGRRDLGRPAAHVSGQNTGNIGIGMLGNFETVEAPQRMQDQVSEALAWLHLHYGIPLDRETIKGHREYAATACPGRLFFPRLGEVVAEAQRLVDDAENTEEPIDVVEDPDVTHDAADVPLEDAVPDEASGPDTRDEVDAEVADVAGPDAQDEPSDGEPSLPDVIDHDVHMDDAAHDPSAPGGPESAPVPLPAYSTASSKSVSTAGCAATRPTHLPGDGALVLLLGIVLGGGARRRLGRAA